MNFLRFLAYSTFLTTKVVYAIDFDIDAANSLDKTTSHIKGPNCWNAALYVSGVVKEKKYSSPEEWVYILENNCSEVQSPEYGDIGRIIEKSGTESHGFIHISDNEIFAKHGEETRDGYRYMSYQEMLRFYGKTRSCRMSGATQATCHNTIKYYKCDSKALKKPNVQNLGYLVQELVFSPATKYHYKDNCESESFLEREMIYKKMLIEIKRAKDRSHLYSKLEYLSLGSLRHQLYNVQVSTRRYRCKDKVRKKLLANKVKYELRELIALTKKVIEDE